MASDRASHGPGNAIWLFVNKLLKLPARALHTVVKSISPGFEQDFFGSDAFSRSTARYTWSANQFGHLALGVIAAAGPGHVIAYLSDSPPLLPVFACGLVFLGLYLLKEVADTQIEVEGDDETLPFQLNLFELGTDSVTDTAFVALGFAGAWFWAHLGVPLVPVWPWLALPSLFGLVFGWLCVRAALNVLPCRGRLDASALPGFARLRRFNGRIDASVFGDLQGSAREGERRSGEACAAAARNVERFVGDPGGVLVLSARDGVSGKTFLALAVGCELVERGKKVRYLTSRSLAHDTYETEQEGALPLAEAEVVVVDGCTGPLRETLDKIGQRTARLPSHMVIVADGERASDKNHAQLHAECGELRRDLRRTVLAVRIVQGLKVRAPNRRRPPEAEAAGWADAPRPAPS